MNTPKVIIKEEKKLSEFEQKIEAAKADAEKKCEELNLSMELFILWYL
jgi:hypothetical protein